MSRPNKARLEIETLRAPVIEASQAIDLDRPKFTDSAAVEWGVTIKALAPPTTW